MIRRKTVTAVQGCPLQGWMSLENCRKCPFHKGYDKWRGEVECDRLSKVEEALAPEPVMVKEPKSRW